MRIARGLCATAATVFMLAACARPAPGEGPAPTPSGGSVPASGDALVVRIERFGGFAGPDLLVGKLPDVSVYADGRMITQGPQILIYPGPALPNVQVQTLAKATVDALVTKAANAGIGAGADYGNPGSIADAPTTRVTVGRGQGGTRSVDVVALSEARPDDPRLTQAQRDARAKLAAFVREVTDLSAAAGVPEPRAYRSTAMAAIARPYRGDGLPSKPPAIAWPGPALPGRQLGTAGCVTVTGTQLAAVLAAAGKANAMTPWTSGGEEWVVAFRPLLPDEHGCADLGNTR